MGHQRMRLALTSLLLSLAPLVAYGFLVALPAFFGAGVVLYAGSYIGSVGAVVTGVRALRGNQQQPPLQPAVRAAAGAGVVIGIAGILLLVFAGVSLALFLLSGESYGLTIRYGCSIHPVNCQ